MCRIKGKICAVLCLSTVSHFLPSFLSLAHSLVTLFLPLALPHFISTFIPTASISHFSRFCLLTFHLSAKQIPLQLPKLCQKALSLFIYFSLLLFCDKQFKWQVLLDGIDSSLYRAWTLGISHIFEYSNWCFYSQQFIISKQKRAGLTPMGHRFHGSG